MFDYYSNLLKLLPGTPCVQATVIDKKGSVPTEIGAKMLVTMEGLIHGTIGGGRVEKKTIEHCISLLQESENGNSKRHETITWSLGKDIGMTCGGTVTFFFEVMNSNIWKIIIFGAGHVAGAIIKLLSDINCHVTCIDFRKEWLDKLPESEKLYKVRLDEMSDYVEKIKTNAFIAITTPGHKYDLEVLSKCIDKDFPYLGVIGSKAKAAFLRKELIKLGFSEEISKKFYCPMGLPLGTNEPQEVAISIVSHLIQERDKLIGSKHWKNLQSKDFLLNNH